jgi:hypothetical protein
MAESFLKLNKTKETNELLKNAPNAFLLLTQIALRAKRTKGFNVQGLTMGQALVGDYKSIGLTEQKYRTAKAQLETWGFATFKGTNKGTIANLINSRIFDINEECGQRARQRSSNDQITTNKNIKNEKNTPIGACPYQAIVNLFNSMLPDLPNVSLITDERKKTIRARWATSDKTQSLDWWEDFFLLVRQSDFLMGRAKDSFRASFDWVIKKSNFVKIIEGNYHR